jgi:alkylation response protein AidB-like acyl-CoA dehydrogenase
MDTQADMRRHAILDELTQRQAVRVSELSQAFGVSEVSVRRDLSRLEREGFLRQTPYELQGTHSIGAAGFQLRQYVAPAEAMLDPPGTAFARSLAGINGARCYVAAMCAGILDSAIGIAVEYASRRKAFGQPVIQFQGLRWSLVDAAADLAALRLLPYRAARLIDAGEPAEEACALAKKFAGDKVIGHLSACVQALGANGLRKGDSEASLQDVVNHQ